jgi:hypothetical protein
MILRYTVRGKENIFETMNPEVVVAKTVMV